MTLNPFIILAAIYWAANTYALALALSNGGFYAFGNFFHIEPYSFVLAYSLQLISLFFIFSSYFIAHNTYHRHPTLDNGYGYFLLFATAAFFIFNQTTGASRAGTGFSFEGSNYANYVFVLLQPDLLFLLIAPFVRSNKLFFTVATLLFVSLILRGWMGSVLLIGCAFLARFYPVKINLKKSFLFILLAATLFASLPFLDALKWGMRSNIPFADVVQAMTQTDYISLYPVVLESIAARFHNLNYVAFSVQNAEALRSALLMDQFAWFYQSGIFNDAYCKLNQCPPDIGIYLAESITGEPNLTWNVDAGLSGWLAILGLYSPIFVLFSILLLALGNLFFGRLFGRRGVLIFSALSLIYLFHGWLSAFANVVIYTGALYVLLRVTGRDRQPIPLNPYSPAATRINDGLFFNEHSTRDIESLSNRNRP